VVLAYLTLAPINDTGVTGIEKSHHFIGVAALAIPSPSRGPPFAPWALLLAVAYGGVIERIQPLMSRDKKFSDLSRTPSARPWRRYRCKPLVPRGRLT
jgi:hypothetical protein